MRKAPVERRADVVDLGIQSRQPLALGARRERGLGRLDEPEAMPAMASMDLRRIGVGVESLAGVCAHGLEHRQAGLARRAIAAFEHGESSRLPQALCPRAAMSERPQPPNSRALVAAVWRRCAVLSIDRARLRLLDGRRGLRLVQTRG